MVTMMVEHDQDDKTQLGNHCQSKRQWLSWWLNTIKMKYFYLEIIDKSNDLFCSFANGYHGGSIRSRCFNTFIRNDIEVLKSNNLVGSFIRHEKKIWLIGGAGRGFQRQLSPDFDNFDNF